MQYKIINLKFMWFEFLRKEDREFSFLGQEVEKLTEQCKADEESIRKGNKLAQGFEQERDNKETKADRREVLVGKIEDTRHEIFTIVQRLEKNKQEYRKKLGEYLLDLKAKPESKKINEITAKIKEEMQKILEVELPKIQESLLFLKEHIRTGNSDPRDSKLEQEHTLKIGNLKESLGQLQGALGAGQPKVEIVKRAAPAFKESGEREERAA